MGSNTSNTVTQNQTVVNSALQASQQTCQAGCTNSLNNATVIVVGGTGDVTIQQTCKLDGIQCIMASTLDNQVQTVLQAMAKQQSSTMAGFSLDFHNVSQNVNLSQYIKNSVTQIMDSSCKFEAANDISGLYFYAKDRNGNLNITQSAAITNSTCNLNNLAKNVTYNTSSAEADQKAEITNIFALVFVIIIVAIIMAGLVAITFFSTGGLSTVYGKGGGDGDQRPPTLEEINSVRATLPPLPYPQVEGGPLGGYIPQAAPPPTGYPTYAAPPPTGYPTYASPPPTGYPTYAAPGYPTYATSSIPQPAVYGAPAS